ncbi:MAG: phosphate signaling complex protein PhoU [Synergistaceae bacterium]|jgi:phosphate transport system protein|nr:phosphate signaling complex protein PhoU [Synergistaceae bacterium]
MGWWGKRGGGRVVEAYLYSSDRDRIVALVLKVGGKVTEALKGSVDALVARDSELARKIVRDDDDVDAMEQEIDHECLRAIAMRQPVREDLRFIFAVLKTITDLERIGDQAVNIARWALELKKYPYSETNPLIPAMRDTAEGMLRDVLEAFRALNGDLSVEICRRDNQIDRMYSRVFNEFIGLMASYSSNDKGLIRFAAGQMWVARHLERVGDHITNIAERVYFVAKGQVLSKMIHVLAPWEDERR